MYTLVPIPKLTQTDMHDRLVLRDLSRRQFVSSVVRKLSHACPPQFFRRTGNRGATRAQRHTVSSASFSTLAYVDQTGPRVASRLTRLTSVVVRSSGTVIPSLKRYQSYEKHLETSTEVKPQYSCDRYIPLIRTSIRKHRKKFVWIRALPLVYFAIGRNTQDIEQVCCFSNFKFSLFVILIISLAKRCVNFLK